MSNPLYLASKSPRRSDLLNTWGWPHILVEPGEEEGDAAPSAEEEVLRRARAKALGAQMEEGAGGIVLGADTIGLTMGGEILGKPRSREEARRFLGDLSGTTHYVLTGVWGRDASSGLGRGGVDVSEVTFFDLSPETITNYLDLGEWQGKAGAYALQGKAAPFVRRLIGERECVVGLSKSLTHWVLRTLEQEWLQKH